MPQTALRPANTSTRCVKPMRPRSLYRSHRPATSATTATFAEHA